MAGRIIKHKTVGESLDSNEWLATDTHELADNEEVTGETIVVSDPPSGYYRVINLYAEKHGSAYHLVYEIEDTPIP